MKTIIITGPSGSGKTYISKKLSKSLDNAIIIKTDSYYRDDLFIKILSFFIYDIYDRVISIKRNEIKKTIISIYNKEKKITFYNYDFKRKRSSKITKKIKSKASTKYIIVEGIFAHRLGLNYKETINCICNDKKKVCYERRLKRDQLQRGREKAEVSKKFIKSWNLFFKNLNKYIISNKLITLNSDHKKSYDKLLITILKI